MSFLDCPFCGGSDIRTTYIRDGRVAQCKSCYAMARPAYNGPTTMPSAEERARQNWNERDPGLMRKTGAEEGVSGGGETVKLTTER